MNIETFQTVPDIIDRYKSIMPESFQIKTIHYQEKLCIEVIDDHFEKTYIEIRDCPGSKYYMCEIIEISK